MLGTGNIGATLAGKWTAAGHQVTLASRNPDAPALRDLAASIGARTATHADAVRDAEVVVVALPGDAVAAMAPPSATRSTATWSSTPPTTSVPPR